jgi:hypothetical protein
VFFELLRHGAPGVTLLPCSGVVEGNAQRMFTPGLCGCATVE